MHSFDAPEAGSGKGKLVNIASVIAYGHEAPTVSYGHDDGETNKLLGAELLAGRQIVAIDNIERPLDGELLCQMLTNTTVRVRILGESKSPAVSTSMFITATGNALVVKGDLVRRTVRCRINANMEPPEDRVFDFDPVEKAKARRADLVVAALTILRAYHVAGQPDEPNRLGSFEAWSDLVRGSLIWLGEPETRSTR